MKERYVEGLEEMREIWGGEGDMRGMVGGDGGRQRERKKLLEGGRWMVQESGGGEEKGG